MKFCSLLLLPLAYGMKIEIQADNGQTIFCDQPDRNIYLSLENPYEHQYQEEYKAVKQILGGHTFNFHLNGNEFQFTFESPDDIEIDHNYLSYNGSTDFGVTDDGQLVLHGTLTTKLKIIDIST